MHALRVVECEAIGDATAPVVPGDREAAKTEPLHDGHHVARHGSFGIRLVVRGRPGAAAAAVAAEIGADDGEMARQDGRHASPHQMRLGKAVQQQDRRAGARSADEDGGLPGLDLARIEIVQHPGSAYRLRLRKRSVAPQSSSSPPSPPWWSAFFTSMRTSCDRASSAPLSLRSSHTIVCFPSIFAHRPKFAAMLSELD